MAKARASKGLLVPPAVKASPGAEKREEWLTNSKGCFVAASANRYYYGIILDLLWPSGHGIPGPHVSEKAIRAALDSARREEGKAPYIDPFRRLRELQGDEGLTCIVKEGTHYQLVSLDVSAKRERREKPKDSLWKAIKSKANFKCSHCEKQEPDIKLSPDHRIPRSRGGDNSDENWQPLCEQCNNLKSAACGGCDSNCHVCFWARPETYKQIMVSDDNKELVRREAVGNGEGQSEVVNKILKSYFQARRK